MVENLLYYMLLCNEIKLIAPVLMVGMAVVYLIARIKKYNAWVVIFSCVGGVLFALWSIVIWVPFFSDIIVFILFSLHA
jgi:hypothetical protein